MPKHEVLSHDVHYQPAWQATIYQPEGDGPFPAIVDVHGGAYHIGDRLNNAAIDRGLAERGILVAALDFRQAQHARYPASLQDVNLGIRWLKAHAAEYNGQRQVGGLGSSSGGNQILLAALRPSDPRYSALELEEAPHEDATLAYVVGCWPVADPLTRYRAAKEGNRDPEGAKAYENYFGAEDAISDGCPQRILDEDEPAELPPAFIAQGTADPIVNPEMQRRFMDSYRRRGGAIRMETFEGMGHTFIVREPDASESIRALDAIASFIHEAARA
jgi:acetyl esterase/lipase